MEGFAVEQIHVAMIVFCELITSRFDPHVEHLPEVEICDEYTVVAVALCTGKCAGVFQLSFVCPSNDNIINHIVYGYSRRIMTFTAKLIVLFDTVTTRNVTSLAVAKSYIGT